MTIPWSHFGILSRIVSNQTGKRTRLHTGLDHPLGELVLERELGFHAMASHTEEDGTGVLGWRGARMRPSMRPQAFWEKP